MTEGEFLGSDTRKNDPNSMPQHWLNKAIAYVDQMRSPESEFHYRLHSMTEPTIFASCFALFFQHLCGETKTWGEGTRTSWLDYLQGFQEKETGLFRDPYSVARVTDSSHDILHLDWQLTGFCLGALHALRAEPLYPLNYVALWCDAQYMQKWLDRLDWSRASNSGNKAMFIAIMLAHELERGNTAALEGLNVWLDWHDAHADPVTGYWCTTRNGRYFQGMTGFVHQFLVYNYLGRRVRFPERVIDRTLLLQQPDGLFSPALGGGACDDLDAIHTLCHMYHTENYRRETIKAALNKALEGVLANQNPDGGFSWARRHRFSAVDWLKVAFHNARSADPYLVYLSLRHAFSAQRQLKTKLETGWSAVGRDWSQSSLWDTWFRTLAVAEIETVLFPAVATQWWRRLDTPNFGWFYLPQGCES